MGGISPREITQRGLYGFIVLLLALVGFFGSMFISDARLDASQIKAATDENAKRIETNSKDLIRLNTRFDYITEKLDEIKQSQHEIMKEIKRK
jgi:hypothetical protein